MRKLLKLLRIHALAVALVPFAASAQVVYHNFPDQARRSATPNYDAEIADLKAALDARLISESPFDIIALANAKHWRLAGSVGIPPSANDGKVKTWFYWSPFEAVVVARNPDGSWAEEAWGESLPGMELVTRELRDFYSAYNASARPHFPTVPKFVRISVSAEEAGRINFGDGPGSDFPVAKITRQANQSSVLSNFPKDVAFALKDGKLVWFSIEDYKKNFPITVNANIPSPVAIPEGLLFMQLRSFTCPADATPSVAIPNARRLLQ